MTRSRSRMVTFLVKALDKRTYRSGFGISYYLSETHPRLAFTHSDLVELAHELAKQHPGAYTVDGETLVFSKCTETSVTHRTNEEREAMNKAKWATALTADAYSDEESWADE